MAFYLETKNKSDCTGCEACIQICQKSAISLIEDDEGFRYPVISENKCISCGMCKRVCPSENQVFRNTTVFTFGGYTKDSTIKAESTSGGFFSAIVEVFCDSNYVIFGAETKGLDVFHSYVFDKQLVSKYRESKYSQSRIGSTYIDVKNFLIEGKKVLFSGTPCQIAGLVSFLGQTDKTNLLTVEVICEGVPSPLYVRKMNRHMEKKYGAEINTLHYRYKRYGSLGNPVSKKWDFQVMLASLRNHKIIRKDRWFNPFWSIWLQHLMSRPSCYRCLYANTLRVADITLGDLWGVHLYCPELYGKNGGCSLSLANTEKGRLILERMKPLVYGHELDYETAKKYQSPLRKTISDNPEREAYMDDLKKEATTFEQINRKWAKKPTIRLLFQKYFWGNRQKVFLWNLLNKDKGKKYD